MKSKQTKLIIIDGCGSELLNAIRATVNYELSGDGAVLVHTDDLDNTMNTFKLTCPKSPRHRWPCVSPFINGMVEKIRDHLKNKDSCTTSKHYEGLILLRR